VGLVITQVALSLVLVTGAGLLVRSVLAAQAVDLGFAVERRLLLPINLRRQGYDEARGRAFLRDALERVAAVPGVEAATVTRMVPFRGMWSTDFAAEGVTPPSGGQFGSGANVVGPGYFAAMEIPVVRGRAFTAADDAAAPPVVVVNQSLARMIWGDADPLGRVIGDGQERRFTVVGVARDARYYDLGEPPQPQLYVNAAQLYAPSLYVLVRTAGPPAAATTAVASALRQADPALVIGAVTTLDAVVGAQLRPYRTLAVTLAAVGVIALVLAALGLYGVLAYLVTRRTREFGIRLALGARAALVTRGVLLQGARLAGFGIVVGGAVVWLGTRLVSGFLFQVDARDPLALLAAPLALLAAALVASYVPARRAAAIHPMEALRHE
jgi:predicted permease